MIHKQTGHGFEKNQQGSYDTKKEKKKTGHGFEKKSNKTRKDRIIQIGRRSWHVVGKDSIPSGCSIHFNYLGIYFT